MPVSMMVVHDDHALPQQLLQLEGGGVDALHPVVEVVYLAVAGQLRADGLRHHAPVVLQHVGLHRQPVVGRLLDGAHVPDAGQGHVHGAGDGGGAEGQGVHLLLALAQRLLVLHAETLLLVDN